MKAHSNFLCACKEKCLSTWVLFGFPSSTHGNFLKIMIKKCPYVDFLDLPKSINRLWL